MAPHVLILIIIISASHSYILNLPSGVFYTLHKHSLDRLSSLHLEEHGNILPRFTEAALPSKLSVAYSLNNEIISCFGNNFDAKKLRQILKGKINILNHVHIITTMQRCAKYNIDVTTIISLLDIKQILKLAIDKKKILNSMEVGNLLYGLKLQTSKSANIETLIPIITILIHDSKVKLSAQEISNALYGLQGLTTRSAYMKDLIAVIIPLIYESESTMSSLEIGLAFYGLKKMSDCDEARNLIEALVKKIETSESVDSLSIGNILLSLQNMDNKSPAVRNLLKAMVPKILSSTQDLTDNAIGSALYGLRQMSTDAKEVRDILNVLSIKIHSSVITSFSSISISSALYGLRSMSHTAEEVRTLLRILVLKIDSAPVQYYDMEPSEFAHALYGLRNMASQDIEVRLILQMLLKRVSATSRPFQSRDLGLALYGLKSMSDEYAEVRAVLHLMSDKIRGCKGSISERDLSSMLYGMQSCSANSTEALSVLAALDTRFAECSEPFSSQSLSMAVYGLKAFNGDLPEVRALLGTLAGKVGVVGGQAIGNILYGLKGVSSDSIEVIGNFICCLYIFITENYIYACF